MSNHSTDMTKRFGWTGWESERDLGNPDDRSDVHFLTIVENVPGDNGDSADEVAVIIHRTCSGKYPLDGTLARDKEAMAQLIADALNAYHQN